MAGAERPDGARQGGRRLTAGAAAAEALEVFAADGAFRALDDYLADAGFWGGEDLVADLYLGYGLSQAIRRDVSPPPPEPCALPLLACRIGASPGDSPSDASGMDIGDWTPTWAPEEYAAAVAAVRASIARGDVYQVNLVQHLSAPYSGDPHALAAALAPLRPLHPRPFVGDGWAVVSASPELFLARRGRRVWTKPIKGTRPLGSDGLADAEKDRAEHVMIVDLERNDLSRVCEPGTVRWPELMVERELAGVAHLVSTVEGRLREEVGLAELFEATFPGGSITGAPKIAAVDHIAALEPVGRGASMGALGRLRSNGDLDLALTIRTFAIADDRIHLWVGGGIVWDSTPEDEIEESWVKARPLLSALA
ncbi:MAG: anthranilate synthase component I family protein [Gaiellaceae bacterium]